jgi:hypothetical protein
MPERMQSPAYRALRASARRLLRFVETEITRAAGGPVTLYQDQFVVVGSVRVILPGLRELQALGFIDLKRFPKCYLIGLSDRWRGIATAEEALSISATARVQRQPASCVGNPEQAAPP